MGVPRVPVPHCRVVLGPETPVAFGCSRGKNLNNAGLHQVANLGQFICSVNMYYASTMCQALSQTLGSLACAKPRSGFRPPGA